MCDNVTGYMDGVNLVVLKGTCYILAFFPTPDTPIYKYISTVYLILLIIISLVIKKDLYVARFLFTKYLHNINF